MKEEERTYKNIRWVLRSHIKNNVRSFWTWVDNNFTCIYKNYSTSERIYTPEQLLKKLEK